MKKSLLALLFATAAFSFISCQKEKIEPQATTIITADESRIEGRIDDCPATEVTLVAGQSINSGTVTVTNDANYIYVTYSTANGWLMTQTHLYVGACALIPVNNSGNPMPGQFPHKSTHNYITSYTYQVPISALPAGYCGCIAAHAVVVKVNSSGQVIESQTAWGNGTRINPIGGNWGMKFDYCSCVVE
jgi:hypothetical protein